MNIRNVFFIMTVVLLNYSTCHILNGSDVNINDVKAAVIAGTTSISVTALVLKLWSGTLNEMVKSFYSDIQIVENCLNLYIWGHADSFISDETIKKLFGKNKATFVTELTVYLLKLKFFYAILSTIDFSKNPDCAQDRVLAAANITKFKNFNNRYDPLHILYEENFFILDNATNSFYLKKCVAQVIALGKQPTQWGLETTPVNDGFPSEKVTELIAMMKSNAAISFESLIFPSICQNGDITSNVTNNALIEMILLKCPTAEKISSAFTYLKNVRETLREGSWFCNVELTSISLESSVPDSYRNAFSSLQGYLAGLEYVYAYLARFDYVNNPSVISEKKSFEDMYGISGSSHQLLKASLLSFVIMNDTSILDTLKIYLSKDTHKNYLQKIIQAVANETSKAYENWVKNNRGIKRNFRDRQPSAHYEIVKATYGHEANIVDVTDILKAKINTTQDGSFKGGEAAMSIFGPDPAPGFTKQIVITYIGNDGTEQVKIVNNYEDFSLLREKEESVYPFEILKAYYGAYWHTDNHFVDVTSILKNKPLPFTLNVTNGSTNVLFNGDPAKGVYKVVVIKYRDKKGNDGTYVVYAGSGTVTISDTILAPRRPYKIISASYGANGNNWDVTDMCDANIEQLFKGGKNMRNYFNGDPAYGSVKKLVITYMDLATKAIKVKVVQEGQMFTMP